MPSPMRKVDRPAFSRPPARSATTPGTAVLFDDLPQAQWMLSDRGYDTDWYRDAFSDEGYNGLHSGPKIPPHPHRIRQAALPVPEPYRDYGGPSEGLAPRRHSLRSIPERLILRCCPRCHRHLLTLINESLAFTRPPAALVRVTDVGRCLAIELVRYRYIVARARRRDAAEASRQCRHAPSPRSDLVSCASDRPVRDTRMPPPPGWRAAATIVRPAFRPAWALWRCSATRRARLALPRYRPSCRSTARHRPPR